MNLAQAGFWKENLSGFISKVSLTAVSTTVSVPFPNGAWMAAASISLASRSVRGKPIGPIPSMCKPGSGDSAKVSLIANFPLKLKSPLRASSRSS
jgi:hypothetical protein